MGYCIFCDIVRGEAPASIVYSDEAVTAFMDIQPVNPGHVLVVPNTHASSLSDLNEHTGAHLFIVAMRIAAALGQSGLHCEGINLFLADGKVAFQEIFHVHLHVVPRHAGDGLRLALGPHYGRRPERAVLNDIAERIRIAGGFGS